MVIKGWRRILPIFLVLFCAVSYGAVPDGERAALIALYNATAGDSWSDNSGWKAPPLADDGFASPGTESLWKGVVVSGDHVTALILDDNNLNGNIPPKLSALTHLTELRLGNNSLKGTVPSELGSLNRLKRLELQNNKLTGITGALGNLSNLEDLYLNKNKISGRIPPEWGGLTKLELLHIHDNKLTGEIPAEFENLKNLEKLALGQNELSGNIPTFLGNLDELEKLGLNNNQFKGNIPPTLGSLKALTYLNLASNGLDGCIPATIGDLGNLQILRLNFNQLRCEIPAELGGLTSLKELYLNKNKLKGPIPKDLMNLTNLDSHKVNIGYNCLSTPDPELKTWLDQVDPDWDEHQSECSSTPSITVKSPNGGENWKVGSKEFITWDTSGFTGIVTIELSVDGGEWETECSDCPPNGQYSWTVPNRVSSKCKIRIKAKDGDTPSDESDSYFSISQELYQLNISSSPVKGVRIDMSPADSNGLSTGYTDFNRTFATGSKTEVTLEAPANHAGREFLKWQVDHVDIYERTVKITMDGNHSAQAFYGPPAYTLKVKSSLGTGIRIRVSAKDKDGKGDGVTPFTRSYNTATDVTLTAPGYNNGKKFLHWLFDNKVQTGQSITIAMGRNHTAKAVYQASTYILTIQSSLDSVPITVTPPDNNELGNGNTQFFRTYDGGTDVTLTAPAAHDGKNFLKWFVDGIEYTTREIQVTIDAIYTARAVYQSATYSLSVQSSPSGIDITVAPPDNNGNGDDVTNFNRTYDSGTTVTLTAPTSFDGSPFSNWEVNGKEFTDSTVQVIMEDNQTAVAYYETSTPPEIAVNRDSFNLGYIIGTGYQPTESIPIYNSGGGTINWTASTEKNRITFSPASGTNYGSLEVTMNPVGLSPGKFSGSIYISDPLVSNSPVEVKVNLWVKAQKDWAPPRGEFVTPEDGAQVSGSLPVTGWVLGDTGIKWVEIFREEDNNLVYIGDAVFIEGARTDIETAYPDYPMNYKAGWGYSMLTNFLPNEGNGTFRLHAIATGNTGKKTTLGIKTITVDNANAVKPFGTINTPGQGGMVFGSNYENWGWALTPPPNTIPIDGSTIDVYIDSIMLGHPTYNIFREDIADLFPGYSNSNGAFGFININTTTYENGSHQIWWIVTDNAGNANGIGSQFFNILNPGAGHSQNVNNLNIETNEVGQTSRRIFPNNALAGLLAVAFKNSESITVFRGFNQEKISQRIFPLQDGTTELIIHETEPIELHLESIQEPALFSPSPGYFYGCMLVGEELRPLPVGSTLDTQKGIFYWIPGPGFFGDYDLLFVKKESNGDTWKKQIRLTIVPKFSR